MKRLCSLALIVLAIASMQVVSEAKAGGTISGKVSDGAGEGLAGAVITLFRENGEGGTISFTRSDRRGTYSIANLSPGSYFLQVSREGYQPLSNSSVRIASGKAVTLNVVLQTFVDLISADPDPRNWDLKTVVRSTSDRRLIFRNLPVSAPDSDALPVAEEPTFKRGAALAVATNSGMGSENYFVSPSSGQNGVVSNFAYTEPVGGSGRMIFSGQLNSGSDSFWQVRDTFHYRTEPGRDLSFSVGYGRLGLNDAGMSSLTQPAEFLNRDPSLRDSGVQLVDVGLAGRSQFLEGLSIDYGFDLTRVYSGATKSFLSPYFQLVLTPADTWLLKAAVASRRASDSNTVFLPDGEPLNLTQPIYIAKIDSELHLSQFKHGEIAVEKTLPGHASVEVALYEDHMNGPGVPFLVTAFCPGCGDTVVAQLREDQTAQHGLRIIANRRILDFLTGSIAYVYGTGTAVRLDGSSMTSEELVRDLLAYMHRSYYHSLTGQMSARFRKTHTEVTAIFRWYPGAPITPMDLFADRADVLTKGVNFIVRQELPFPEFMNTVGRWEALVDVRNLFDQGNPVIPTSDGELVLTRNPRSLRFGLNLNLY
jgi:Carboxypeptidase regulatory-like domain